MFEEFCYREKRCHLYSIGLYPVFIDTGTTNLPEGNAHYSMYGLTKGSARTYQKLYTRQHEIYEHYSSEIIIDAETARALAAVLAVCKQNNWSYRLYETGSGSTGGHVHIPRETEPSEILYLRDKMFVEKYFEGIPDIDTGILHPMHLIRGIGKVHEETGKKKRLVQEIVGSVLPSVRNISVTQILLDRHSRIKTNYKLKVSGDWTRAQNTFIRHNPDGVKVGGRYTAIYCFSRDLLKCGFDEHTIKAVVAKFSSYFEEPCGEATCEKAYNDAERSYNRE